MSLIVGTAPAHNKPKKPGHYRPEERRNGVLEETKKHKHIDRTLCFF
jgi:hypothetical protein